eukprot:15048580-Alexandrium_andersonii.AAC.1
MLLASGAAVLRVPALATLAKLRVAAPRLEQLRARRRERRPPHLHGSSLERRPLPQPRQPLRW